MQSNENENREIFVSLKKALNQPPTQNFLPPGLGQSIVICYTMTNAYKPKIFRYTAKSEDEDINEIFVKSIENSVRRIFSCNGFLKIGACLALVATASRNAKV